jgi:elongation factor 1 alpha-like protein
VQTGYSPAKTSFVPVAAVAGINLVSREASDVELFKWYKGPTLVELLGMFLIASSAHDE